MFYGFLPEINHDDDDDDDANFSSLFQPLVQIRSYRKKLGINVRDLCRPTSWIILARDALIGASNIKQSHGICEHIDPLSELFVSLSVKTTCQ